jgi:hypothetical protein
MENGKWKMEKGRSPVRIMRSFPGPVFPKAKKISRPAVGHSIFHLFHKMRVLFGLFLPS